MVNLSSIFSKQSTKTPIWLMRQAGRYLPQYRAIRAKTTNFLEFCYNSELAFEVSMQPLEQFNFDAAIVFSDILVIPDAMGYKVEFIKNHGPRLDTITLSDIDNFHNYDFYILLEKLNPTYQTISKIKKTIDNKNIIGFCGAPWTVATYMINGAPSADHHKTRLFAYKEKVRFLKLLDFLAEFSALYLIKQIEAGADIVQIFDSWAGILPYDEFIAYCAKPVQKMVEIIKSRFPSTPIIGFPKGANSYLEEYVKITKIDGISVDNRVNYNSLKHIQQNIVVQGNLDPLILIEGGKLLEQKIEEIMAELSGGNFIFNLSHGILPQTPIEHVSYLVEKVRSYNA